VETATTVNASLRLWPLLLAAGWQILGNARKIGGQCFYTPLLLAQYIEQI
jgi:hypothetical protein